MSERDAITRFLSLLSGRATLPCKLMFRCRLKPMIVMRLTVGDVTGPNPKIAIADLASEIARHVEIAQAIRPKTHWLFPSHKDPRRHLHINSAQKCAKRAARLAGLPPSFSIKRLRAFGSNLTPGQV